jgi:hypothetical protein
MARAGVENPPQVLSGARDAKPQASVTSRKQQLDESDFIGWINLLSRVSPKYAGMRRGVKRVVSEMRASRENVSLSG